MNMDHIGARTTYVCGVKNAFGILVHSKEYAFPILLL
jgi:hypothetical protein